MTIRKCVGHCMCSVSTLIGAVLFAAQAQAQITNLPDAASPGASQSTFDNVPKRSADNVDLSIPPRKDRPLDLEAGPKILVTDINLFEVTASGQVEQVHDDGAMQIIDGFKSKGETTLGGLQQLADEVTNYFRSEGAILSTVYVPAQDVVDKTVNLHMLRGRLEDVIPAAAGKYSAEQLRKPFAALIGKPVNKADIESSLLTVLDFPGIDVSGVLQPGSRVGAAQMALNVQETRPYSGLIFLDNNGSRFTGEERLGATLTAYNPLGLVDQLDVNLNIQNKPDAEAGASVGNAYYGGFSYQLRPFDPSYTIAVAYNQNSYDVGLDLATLGFTGETSEARISLRKQFERSRTFNWYGQAGLKFKTAEVEKDGVLQNKDEQTSVWLEAGFDATDSLLGGAFTQASLRFTQGLEDTLGSQESNDVLISRRTDSGFAAVDFSKIEINMSRYQRLLHDNINIIAKFRAQYSDDALVSIEQFALGGSANVRAYSGSEYMADKGFYMGLEMVSNAPGFRDKKAFNDRTWGEVLQFSLFFDYASGVKNDALANEDKSIDLSGIGVGLRLNFSDSWSANLTVATPVGDVDAANGRDPQIFGEIAYKF